MTDAANQKIRECGFETLHAGQEVDEQKSTGLTPDYVRLSVGLGSIDDILYDLDRAPNGA